MRSFLIGVLALGVAGLAVAADSTKTVTKPKKAGASAMAVAGDKAVKQIEDFIAKAKIDKTKDGWKTSLPKPEVATFDPAHSYFVRMETNKGPILIKFRPDVAPMHVTNFIYLTKLGFYDGLSFHRVISGFMAQGGDPAIRDGRSRPCRSRFGPGR